MSATLYLLLTRWSVNNGLPYTNLLQRCPKSRDVGPLAKGREGDIDRLIEVADQLMRQSEEYESIVHDMGVMPLSYLAFQLMHINNPSPQLK